MLYGVKIAFTVLHVWGMHSLSQADVVALKWTAPSGVYRQVKNIHKGSTRQTSLSRSRRTTGQIVLSMKLH